jgi:hypothetical protein
MGRSVAWGDEESSGNRPVGGSDLPAVSTIRFQTQQPRSQIQQARSSPMAKSDQAYSLTLSRVGKIAQTNLLL